VTREVKYVEETPAILKNEPVGIHGKPRVPIIPVTILGKEWPALLDSGSTVSIVGDEIIKWIKERDLKLTELHRTVSFLKGELLITHSIKLTVRFQAGIKRVNFLLAPGTIKSVLLGRDFIGPTNIGIFVGLGGWTIGRESQALIPFLSTCKSQEDPVLNTLVVESNLNASLENQDDYDSDSSEGSEDEMFDLDLSSTEKVLANWSWPRLDEDPSEYVEEESLFKDKPDSLLAPTYLKEEEKRSLNQMLEEFVPLFSKRPGLCTLYQHTIDTADSKPLKCGLRPMNAGKRAVFDETFDELLEYGIIEPSYSPWSALAFIVPKPESGHRFVINYKPLNKLTVPDKYPVPRIDDMLSFLGGANYFSTFDLAKGFHQIEVSERDRPKTAFISHRGHWQFRRLPMGLSNSPATFQRCMDEVLGDLKWKICLCYFDDIIVFSKTFEEHVKHIQMVLDRLMAAGLTIHPKKVQLCRQRLKFLGFIVEPGKCFPDPDKVVKIRNFPVPKCVKDIQAFLGLIGFYRKFIPEVSKKAKPLTTLTQKNVVFIFGETELNALNFLKNSLSEMSELYLPDLNSPFIITTDASIKGLGAILSQEQQSIRHPIWFASRCLKPAETRYSATDLELLAVIWAIEKFRGFIEYTHFILETDHSALTWLQRMKEPSGRLARWSLTLQLYDFEVRHKPGESVVMRGPDALSRYPDISFIAQEDATIHDLRKKVIAEQEIDNYLGQIRNHILTGAANNSPTDRIRVHAERGFITSDGMLMRYIGDKGRPWEDEAERWKIWVPLSMQQEILTVFHSDLLAGHLGVRKTYFRLELRFYWFGMRRDVGRFIRACPKCQACKHKPTPTVPATSLMPQSPWDIIAIDLMGPYPRSARQNETLLVVVDMFTKYVELFPLRSATAEKIIDCLRQICFRWGFPRTILSDNGSQFGSNIYLGWCKANYITPFHIAVYHAQANMTERYNETIKQMIVTVIERSRDWEKYLGELAFALRTAVNNSTEFSPAYANLCRELRSPVDNGLQLSFPFPKTISELQSRMTHLRDVIRDNIVHSQDKYLQNYNEGKREHSYEVGDQVWYRTHFLSDASKGFNAKLAPKRELCEVTQKRSSHVQNLRRVEDGQEIRNVHSNDLLPFVSGTE
jgi:hypothetical protein